MEMEIYLMVGVMFFLLKISLKRIETKTKHLEVNWKGGNTMKITPI